LQVSHASAGIDNEAGAVPVAPESYAGVAEGEVSHALVGGLRGIDQKVKFGVMHGLRVKFAAMLGGEVGDEAEGGGGEVEKGHF
jgi:hypothetical protein